MATDMTDTGTTRTVTTAATTATSPAAGDATFLLEIGAEELPSGAIAPAVEQVRLALLARLESERLGVAAENVRTYATPRRLTFVVSGLPARQPDAQTEVRGPSAKAAFGPDGAPTKAAQGFAAKNGVAPEALRVVGEYVVADRLELGRPTGDVLGAFIPDLLKTATFPKFMRWGAGTYRWGRPLRRFVALLGDEIVPFEVEGIASGRATVGHRFLAPDIIHLASPDGYADALRSAFVEPEPEIRRAAITEQAQRLATEAGGVAVLTPALLDENVYLTEWVTAVLGSFDPAYLELPRPVLVTAMQKHQRYFPVEGPSGDLLPRFIAIRSGDDRHLDTVRDGYEKVLASRFSDAKFFFDHDRESRLADKTDRLARIVFQEKLGTMGDKTARLLHILENSHLLAWTHDADNARRAVHLAKVDLGTEIVAELPALQGVMGREFARMDGEAELVAVALYEQYLPRFAGDALPDSRIGVALALADRTDTLVGYMRYVGAEPKGSSDPFGLKRAAGAIVDLLARDRKLPLLSVLLASAQAAYDTQGLAPSAKQGDLITLVEARLRGVLEERGIRYDVADAVLAAPWDSVASVIARADALSVLRYDQGEISVAQTAMRVRNILRSVKEPITTDLPRADVLTAPQERTLLTFLETVGPPAVADLDAGDYTDAMDTLAALTAPIGSFFDGVLVMDENPDIRAARLALLAHADRLYLRLADFSKLVTEG